MIESFEGGMQSIRMNYCLPCPQPEEIMGFIPHSDAVARSHHPPEVNEMEGLQVKKDGIWPVSSLITEQTPAAYTRIGVQEFFKAFFARKLQGKSYLDDLRI
ncbi:hypothetical protein M0R45_014510 [Rubus argutus]|uniref:Uncharacterized protein n=1 Tax=Rubus argutus TaxID=59490 RepID=A0AAW1XP18_RUBAR